jgi:hypothetical protein
MTVPRDPQNPARSNAPSTDPTSTMRNTQSVATGPTAAPASTFTASPAPATTPRSAPPRTGEGTESGSGTKITAAALLAGAAALANKVRKEAPKKAREVREKRVAGRCIILTEISGRPVALGPYRDEQAARQDLTRAAGAPQVFELKSPTAYFGPPNSDSANMP